MEIKKRLDFRNIFVGVYVLAFIVYVMVGLQPAEAANYDITGKIDIPSIGLSSDVTTLTLNGHKLDTPDEIVGSYAGGNNKTLLIGHSTTAFKDLNQINLQDIIKYNDDNYRVVSIVTLLKSRIDMNEVLMNSKKETIVVMTCAGELYEGGDASHRLIVEAIKD